MAELPKPEVLAEAAAKIILEHARDVEFLSVLEMTYDDENRFAGLTPEQHEEACQIIHDLIPKATITIQWPQELVLAWRGYGA